MKKSSLRVLLISCLLYVSWPLAGQQTSRAGNGAVSELIFPAVPKLQSNYNLFYEVRFTRDKVPTPSFWYKIVFSEACSFRFSLFPLKASDGYYFYAYRVKDDYDFCRAISEGKVISCDTAKSAGTHANLQGEVTMVKSIEAEKGDAVYIEVMSSRGNDGGHVIDFRGSDSTVMVVKVINEYQFPEGDTVRVMPHDKELIQSDADAQAYLCKTLSSLLNLPLFVSSIHVKNGKESGVNNKVDFRSTGKGKQDEAGGIAGGSLRVSKKPVYASRTIPDKGLFYTVQVGFYKAPVPARLFKGLSPVYKVEMPAGVKFETGAFNSLKDALKGRDFARSLGNKDAFVVCYFNGKRISREEALSRDKN